MMYRVSVTGIILIIILSACSGGTQSANQGEDGLLHIVATTSIVGDVVSQIGGDKIVLTVLLPPGTDPHGFQPTPQDMAYVADADIIFFNGAGLETFMQVLIDNSGTQALQIEVSDGISLIEAELHDDHGDEDPGNDEESSEGDHIGDPHVWMDPNNVLLWVDRIEQTLIEIDSKNASFFQQSATVYRQELINLDQWIREQVSQIPLENRELVTDHRLFAYFAQRYGFKQIGAIVPGYSSLSEPSAMELAQLEDAIREHSVRAILVGNTVNPSLAERVAYDTGTELVFFYTGSLTEPDGPAPTYLEYMRFNVNAIVESLK